MSGAVMRFFLFVFVVAPIFLWDLTLSAKEKKATVEIEDGASLEFLKTYHFNESQMDGKNDYKNLIKTRDGKAVCLTRFVPRHPSVTLSCFSNRSLGKQGRANLQMYSIDVPCDGLSKKQIEIGTFVGQRDEDAHLTKLNVSCE